MFFKKKVDSNKLAELYINFAYNGIPSDILRDNDIYDEYTFILDGLNRYRPIMTDDDYDYAIIALQKRMDLIRRR
jgi:hypothetical protein